MRLSTEQLPQHLARGLVPLYTVFGDEPLLALEAADRIRARARAESYTEREVLISDPHFDWSQLRASAQSQSLFAQRRLLELRIPNGKPGVAGAAALERFSAQLPAETVTLVSLPGIDWRGQRAAWFEALESSGTLVEARRVARSALPAWLAGRLKAQQQHADADTLECFAECVEGNLLAAYQEVQKLGLLFPPGALTLAQVRAAVFDVARFEVSDLGAAVIAGDQRELARVLAGLQGEGVAPPLVLWAITDEIRAIAALTAALDAGRPLPQALQTARIRGRTRQTLLQQHVRRFTSRQAEAALLHAAAIDRMIKGLAKGDVWDELLQLGLRFAAASRPSAAKTR